MKVVFLQDNGINESLSLTDIAGLLEDRGHECDLFLERNERNFYAKIADSDPGLIVVPMDIWGEKKAIDIAGEVKRKIEVPIVFAGTFPLLIPEVIEKPGVDMICVGEAEFPILELADAIESGKDYSGIPNLHIKRDGEIIRNGMRPLLQDLTLLPLPDRDIYFKYPFMRDVSIKRFTSGRGCPNACSFCFNAKFKEIYHGKGGYVRRKPVKRIIEEIEDMKRIAPLKSIHFADDLFTDDRKWVLEFCEEYASRFDMPWTCNTAVHAVNEEMIVAMKRSHCSGIAMGVEAGREYIRMAVLNKPYRDRQVIRVAELIKKYGLYFTSFNIMALPGETVEDAFATVRFNRHLRADNVRAFFLSPIPRTRLAEQSAGKGYLSEDYNEKGPGIMTLEVHSPQHKKLHTLYYLIDIALISPFFEKIVRLLLDVKLPGFILFLLLLPRMNRERKFFRIEIFSGLKFFLNTSLPQNRTKNFNNYLP